MRSIIIMAVALAACGGKGGEGTQPGPANTTPAPPIAEPAEPVPEPSAICERLFGGDRRCVTELEAFLAKWPAEVRDDTLRCLGTIKSRDEIDACDPDKLAAKRGVEPPAGVQKQKTIEARELVKKLYDGARAYYMDRPAPGITPVAPQFPNPGPGVTPPLGSCCKQGGKCQPDASLWMPDTWVALQFSVDDPHYYSYEYSSADPAKEFTVSAYGDLDCDGVYSTFRMIGEAGPDGPPGNAALFRQNELE